MRSCAHSWHCPWQCVSLSSRLPSLFVYSRSSDTHLSSTCFQIMKCSYSFPRTLTFVYKNHLFLSANFFEQNIFPINKKNKLFINYWRFTRNFFFLFITSLCKKKFFFKIFKKKRFYKKKIFWGLRELVEEWDLDNDQLTNNRNRSALLIKRRARTFTYQRLNSYMRKFEPPSSCLLSQLWSILFKYQPTRRRVNLFLHWSLTLLGTKRFDHCDVYLKTS